MPDFLDKRRKHKLYKQWIDTSGLPKEEILKELQPPDQHTEEMRAVDEELQDTRHANGSYVHLKVRYVLYIGFIIILLIILIAILGTILIMQSC